MVSNELLCLYDIQIDLILVGACKKKMLLAIQEFLCLGYGGVTQDEALPFGVF